MARVLLIDDDDALRRMLTLTLTRHGHEVVEAGDGEAGLALHRDHPVDVVVTDIIMPARDGIEAIIALQRPDWRVPVIAMSGGGNIGAADYLLVARKLGACATLQKPFAAEELLAAIAAAVERASRPGGPAA